MNVRLQKIRGDTHEKWYQARALREGGAFVAITSRQ